MAILEAMSDGMPVVATPVGGIQDVIAHERDARLVHVGDQAALRAAMGLYDFQQGDPFMLLTYAVG
jgi:glycosyltransferase involved in cell wall biosynthesis